MNIEMISLVQKGITFFFIIACGYISVRVGMELYTNWKRLRYKLVGYVMIPLLILTAIAPFKMLITEEMKIDDLSSTEIVNLSSVSGDNGLIVSYLKLNSKSDEIKKMKDVASLEGYSIIYYKDLLESITNDDSKQLVYEEILNEAKNNKDFIVIKEGKEYKKEAKLNTIFRTKYINVVFTLENQEPEAIDLSEYEL